ncbi:MAG: hypothetical protein OEW68_04465 [Gammaproteobacteria bacterium]|nr:hypothetical protein [Gammaproteobacteria bacterium]MDH4314077.1 hypothetical protein [Gammaproteobacteria bacterium]MDH5213120.1 hypothetical protein [Gammaproteobacteria bacterium]MDH5500415.1 hypothetical protein [Gammaproteobacteria bacterium]
MRLTSAFFAALLAMAICGNARAETHPLLTSKFTVQGGTFLPRIDFRAGVDASASLENPDFDLEGQLGVSNRDNLVSGNFDWRFTPDWSAHLQYFEVGRSGTAVLQQDVNFGDVIFQQGSSVTAGTNTTILRAFLGREFSQKEYTSYGVGAGLHRLSLSLSLSGDIVANGMQLLNQTRAVGTTAPLPNIGAWYGWSPSPKWLVGARIDWLAASIGDYSGGLLNTALGVDYQLSRHFGIGAKYQIVRLSLDIDKPAWTGNVELEYEGAYIYLSANWD